MYIYYIYIYKWQCFTEECQIFSKIRVFSKNLLYKTKSPDISKSMMHENVTNELKKKHL